MPDLSIDTFPVWNSIDVLLSWRWKFFFAQNFVSEFFRWIFQAWWYTEKTTSVNLGCFKWVKAWGCFTILVQHFAFSTAWQWCIHRSGTLTAIEVEASKSFGCLSGEEAAENASRSNLYEGYDWCSFCVSIHWIGKTKDSGKCTKNTRMEFEETRTHTHTSIRCSWFTSLEPLYQFFVPYQTMWLWLVFPSSYFGVRVCVLIISSCQVTSTNFNNQLWQPTSTTNFDNQTSKLLYLRSVCLSMTRWTKSTLTPALLVPENPPRMTSRSRGMKVDGSIQRRFSTRSNGKSRGLRVEAVDPSWWGTTELWIFLRITSPKVSQSFWMDLGIWNDRLCIYYMYIC